MNELMIIVEEMHFPNIKWNKEELKAQISEFRDGYADAIIQNDEDYKAAKNDRAEINAVLKKISDQRIQVKKAVMKPYEVFEKELKDAQSDLEDIQKKIASTIKEYEDEQSEKKLDWIKDVFARAIEGKDMDFLTLDMIFDKKWMNKSTKEEDTEKAITARVDTIYNNLLWIAEEEDTTIRATARKQYEETLEFGAIVRLVADIKRRREEEEKKAQEARDESRQNDLEALRNRLNPPNEATSTPPDVSVPDSDENASEGEIQRYFSAFCVRGTAEQIMRLRESAAEIGLSVTPLRSMNTEYGRVYVEGANG